MKAIFSSLICIALLAGCAMGPSPEAQSKQIEQERQAARQQAEFQKGLPPVPNG
ncbi:MAG: hypothetical protein ABI795_05605 [Chthoniobacterales bacterium]|nr:hypothetical protein [Chthoniobacterales bacterium]